MPEPDTCLLSRTRGESVIADLDEGLQVMLV